DVAREAEKLTQRSGSFTRVADHGRLIWSFGILPPVVLAVLLPIAIWPGLCFALLQRQLLLDVEVPHAVALVSASKEIWPIGDKIKIVYRVTGEYSDDMVGSVLVRPEGQAGDI